MLEFGIRRRWVIFHVASSEDIKSGKVTDVYFQRTIRVLNAASIKKRVVMEVRANSLPDGYEWAVLAGVEEAARLLEGLECSAEAMEEGSIFRPGEPVMRVEGEYTEFGIYETPLLGLLCQASGIASKAARCKKAADARAVISFGARRMHPALAPMIERNAFIGGCDGVATVAAAQLLCESPVGTMPHALILIVGSLTEALKLFDQHIELSVRRVALIDTFADEKFEALNAAAALGEKLFAVRFDTPSSRRGDMVELLSEVRWELDMRGYRHVKLFVSGGVDEYEILKLNPVADAYGVGTSISNAPVINFAMDIVEIEGVPIAKRGKESGVKEVYRCEECLRSVTLPRGQEPSAHCACGGQWQPALSPLTRDGKIVRDLPKPQEIRQKVLKALEKVEGIQVGR